MSGDLPIIPHGRPAVGAAEARAAADAVESGWLAGGGPAARRLAGDLAHCTNTEAGALVASGTLALEAALRLVGVDGRDVALPAFGCASLRRAVLRAGGRPRSIDVARDDLSYDPSSLPGAVSGCAAIVAVHQFGVPARIDEIVDCVDIPVVEDVTTAFGGARAGRPLGGRGRVTVLSMAATKMLCAGEGGAVLGAADDIARVERWLEPESDLPDDSLAVRATMSEMAAAVGVVQLERLPDLVARRASIAQVLAAAAADAGVEIVEPRPGDRGAWWRFLALVAGPGSADGVVARARERGVVFARPVLSLPPGAAPSAFPVSDELCRRCVSVPVFPSLTDSEVERVADAVRYAFASPAA